MQISYKVIRKRAPSVSDTSNCGTLRTQRQAALHKAWPAEWGEGLLHCPLPRPLGRGGPALLEAEEVELCADTARGPAG